MLFLLVQIHLFDGLLPVCLLAIRLLRLILDPFVPGNVDGALCEAAGADKSAEGENCGDPRHRREPEPGQPERQTEDENAAEAAAAGLQLLQIISNEIAFSIKA